jgi:SH3-like domain-containing protein
MTRYFILILALVASSVLAKPAKIVIGTVNVKNKLNVRVKPGKQYFVVSSLKNGDKVKIYRKVEGWYEIAAPMNSEVWIAGHLVGDSLTRRPANLRAGPSSDYQSYCTEPIGVELEIIKKKGHGGWFKIKPPVDLKAWVNSSFVSIDEFDVEELENSRSDRKLILIDNSTGSYSGFLKEKHTKPPFLLPFIRGAEREVTLKGQIVPLKEGAVYVTHAVISAGGDDDLRPLAYLHCKNASLNIWKDKIVTITGIKKLVRGWKLPIVEVKVVIPEHAKVEKSKK